MKLTELVQLSKAMYEAMYENHQKCLAKEETEIVEESEQEKEPERERSHYCPLQQEEVECGDWCKWYSSLCDTCEFIQALGSIAVWAERQQ